MTVALPIDLKVFRDTVQAWFANATGLQTIWRDQSAMQPEYPFASLLIINGPDPVAPQWEERLSFDSGRPQGEEYQIDVGVPCMFTVSCQAYVGMPAARAANLNAVAYVARAQSALSLPSVLAAFREKNIAVVRPEAVLNLDELVGDAYVSRANMDVVFGASLSLSEYTGYIDKAELKSAQLGIDILVDAS